MSDQVDYLEKLLEGYRARYNKGERNLADKIRVTAAKLDELRLKEHYDSKKSKAPAKSYPPMRPRRCCGR